MGKDLELHLNFLAQTDELPFTFNENKSWDASKFKEDLQKHQKNITIHNTRNIITVAKHEIHS